jgi:pimeloyl-ACP methyl ester carboxylesterase
MSLKRWLLAGYGLALTASLIYRLAHPPTFPLGNKHIAHAGVRIAYLDTAPGSAKPVLLLIHGSPGSSRVMRALAGLVDPTYRVIAPDLPGFGASEHDIPDYSFQAHARYLLALLDRLHIAKVHAAGFSMGGGVVLSMQALAPQRVCSIEMISALGVQEHELTGSYWPNHALHGLQLGLLWGLKHAAPNFGAFDGDGLNVEYARNFYDSDQRPLHAVLAHYRGPMLIVHGEEDRNVPPSAAREHHRLVPQSELIALPTNHFATFQRPELIAGPLNAFLNSLLNKPEHSCAP